MTLPSHQPLNELLTQFVITTKGSRSKVAPRKACPGCGLTFARFRQVGTLGCPDCYQAFEPQLAPLIERAQNGATHHSGKTPLRAGSSVDRQMQVKSLVKELDEAVAPERCPWTPAQVLETAFWPETPQENHPPQSS